MARLALNKSSLQREQRKLTQFKRFLPSLDLKRRQLMAERLKARRALADKRAEIDRLSDHAAETLPMLADTELDGRALIDIKAIERGTENVVGVSLPTLARLELESAAYSLLLTPHWLDALCDRLAAALRAQIELEILEERLAILDAAVKTVTQRVNLFEKVLIPQSQAAIRKISIYLSDSERAAVVRAKVAKAKQAAL